MYISVIISIFVSVSMAVPLDCEAATDRVVFLFLFFSFVQNVINYT